jgi:hypothetical protein
MEPGGPQGNGDGRRIQVVPIPKVQIHLKPVGHYRFDFKIFGKGIAPHPDPGGPVSGEGVCSGGDRDGIKTAGRGGKSEIFGDPSPGVLQFKKNGVIRGQGIGRVREEER